LAAKNNHYFMKKTISRFFMAMALVVGIGLGVLGLESYAPAPAAVASVLGSTYYTSSTKSPIYYGKLDTVGSSATDTFKGSCATKPVSITFSNDVLKVAGTPTVTVALYVSANGGTTYDNTPVTTYTVVPGSLTAAKTNTYVVNSGFGGNPYTNYMWVATNSASATVAWQGTGLVR
jgi:hypothetical protein